MNTLYVLSDLHLDGPKDPLYQILLNWLKTIETNKNVTLVLAGDIFDFYVGNKLRFKNQYQEFFNQLERLILNQVEVHYIEGNHDFHLKKSMGSISGLKLHEESVILDFNGIRLGVAHGDLANPLDWSYRLLRKFFRSTFVEWLIDVLPDEVLEWIGKNSSRWSREQAVRLPETLPKNELEKLRQIYRDAALLYAIHHKLDFVVFGHCHDQDRYETTLNGKKIIYANVGFPRAHGTLLEWNEKENHLTTKKLVE